MSFDLSQYGRTWQAEEFRVNTVRLAQFAAAIDDECPAHRLGTLAAPLFANVPPMQPCIEALRSVTPVFAFHGEHDFHFHQPIRAGMRLYSQAALHGVVATRGGVSIVVLSHTHDAPGTLIDEQYFTAFVAGATLAAGVGAGAPKPQPIGELGGKRADAEATHAVAADQTLRYADAARDYADYTLRLDAARARGFAHVLLHGMLTMAFAARAVVQGACGGDSTRLKRLAGRFSSPVFLIPHQALTTRIWRVDNAGDRQRFAFQTTDVAGALAIKHGLAEIAP